MAMQMQVTAQGPDGNAEECKPFSGSSVAQLVSGYNNRSNNAGTGYRWPGPLRPSAPAAPPPCNCANNTHRHRSMRDRWREAEEKMGDTRCPSLIWIAVGSLLLTSAAAICTFACLSQTAYCPVQKGGVLFPIAVGVYALNVLLGYIAGDKATLSRTTAHLIFSVLALVLSGFLVALALRFWLDIGMYGYGDKPVLCVIDAYDPERAKYIHRYQQGYDFKKCLVELKVGLSSNALLIFFGLAQGLLHFFAASICCVRLCTVCKKANRSA